MLRPCQRLTMTLVEFLDWCSHDDRRFELFDGRVVSMSPPSQAHGTIVGNIATLVGPVLRAKPPCRMLTEAGIISPTRDDTLYQADLVVTCRPHGAGEQTVGGPLVIVEVLSPSTEGHDRKVKLGDYRELDSVQEILLVDQDRMFCEIHRRLDEERWIVELLLTPDSTLRLESIAVEVSLDDVYANVALLDTAP